MEAPASIVRTAPDHTHGVYRIYAGVAPGSEDVGPPVATPAGEAARLLGEGDARQAIRFVRANADHWGLEPNRIGIGGFSAGGGAAVAASSSARLFELWRAADRPAELHIYAASDHGFGMLHLDQPSDGWTSAFKSWLSFNGWIDRKPAAKE